MIKTSTAKQKISAGTNSQKRRSLCSVLIYSNRRHDVLMGVMARKNIFIQYGIVWTINVSKYNTFWLYTSMPDYMYLHINSQSVS